MKHWFALGLELGLIPPTMDHIKLKYSGETERCIKKMLHGWLKQEDEVSKHGGASWQTLVAALKTPRVNEKEIANHIQEKYLTPSPQPEVTHIVMHNSHSLVSQNLYM